jgi:kynurenine formamidase
VAKAGTGQENIGHHHLLVDLDQLPHKPPVMSEKIAQGETYAIERAEQFGKAEPGLGVDGAKYLADLGVVAIGADSWGLEVIPFEEGTGVFEVHQTLLAKHGVYILENMNTAEPAANDVHEFMFVLGQPKIKGAVQMIINPIAIR